MTTVIVTAAYLFSFNKCPGFTISFEMRDVIVLCALMCFLETGGQERGVFRSHLTTDESEQTQQWLSKEAK